MIYYDFHIHSCLSPCGDNDMTPNNIVNMAFLNGLDAISVCDHNCAGNLPAIEKVANKVGVLLLPGIEVCTAEEFHVQTFFSSVNHALAFSDYLYEHLPPIKNQPSIFGEQFLMDENDEIIGFIDKLLISATDISFDRFDKLAKEFNFVYVPSHIEKSSYSVISSLGMLPDYLSYHTVEIKNINKIEDIKRDFPLTQNMNIISNSDAHFLYDINSKNNSINVNKDIKDILKFLNGGY